MRIHSPRATASAWYEVDMNWYGIWTLRTARTSPGTSSGPSWKRNPPADSRPDEDKAFISAYFELPTIGFPGLEKREPWRR